MQKRCFSFDRNVPSSDIVQFAEGSKFRLLGIINVKIQVGTKNSPCYLTTFYLTCDVLLGEDFLDHTAAFKDYAKAFAPDCEDNGTCEVNTIVWFNMIEAKVARIFTRSPTTMYSNRGEFAILCSDRGMTVHTHASSVRK